MRNAARLLILVALLAGCRGGACPGTAPPDLDRGHALLDPDGAEFQVAPPPSYDVLFETSEGDVRIRVFTEWAPLGAQRFYNLVRTGFYDGSRFFRVLPGFAVQFGANGTPQVDRIWSEQVLEDEPRRADNETGTLAFAMAGPGTRSTQLFFNYRVNEALDDQGFAPIGRIVEGADALHRLNSDYGEPQPLGRGPSWECIMEKGNGYMRARYPDLDSIVRATVLTGVTN
ncbi:MAG TPA: peptidylprolyl isomerase [Longimicrobiales bacterium]|nr:peptidylprolyl isomerase [Longimicrobiales bacterium]